MKVRTFSDMFAVTSVAALAAPVELAAQELENNEPPRHTVTLLGSLGGTASGASSINERGWVSAKRELTANPRFFK